MDLMKRIKNHGMIKPLQLIIYEQKEKKNM